MALPETMRIIAYEGAGGADVARLKTVPVPELGEGQVLIRVAAAGVNRPDIVQREGLYPAPKGAPEWPGLEVAGEIVAAKGVKNFAAGDRVMALLAGGGYAEYAAADEECLLPMPQGMSFAQAAAVPETYFTVWGNVFDRAKLRPGEVLLAHGGSSGIGTAAIHLAKAFGAKVIVTAGTAEKCEACRRLGADIAINYREQDFVEEVAKATDGKGANVILDMIGGDYTVRNYKAAAVEGRIVQIAFLLGAKPQINLNLLMVKRLVHMGSTLRARDKAFKGAIAAELQAKVAPLWGKGQALPVIDKVFPFEKAAEAQSYLESGAHIGKVVLSLEG